MKNQSSENKLVITEEFIFDQNKLSKDPNNHFKSVFFVESEAWPTVVQLNRKPYNYKSWSVL